MIKAAQEITFSNAIANRVNVICLRRNGLAWIWVARLLPLYPVCWCVYGGRGVWVWMRACISLYQSVWLSPVLLYQKLLLHSVPQNMCLGIPEIDSSSKLNPTLSCHSNSIHAEVVKLSSIVPCFWIWDLQLSCHFCGSSYCCDVCFSSCPLGFTAVIQHFAVWSFVFFLSLSFVCILCTLLLRGWGAGKDGGLTMHCGTECSCDCIRNGVEVITLSGCFLGKERRRIPGGGG